MNTLLFAISDAAALEITKQICEAVVSAALVLGGVTYFYILLKNVEG